MAEENKEILEEELKKGAEAEPETPQEDAESMPETAADEETKQETPETEEEDAETEAPETPQEGGDAAEEKKEKKGVFGKKKKDKKDEQIEDLNDRLRRQMAEFDNFRKRTEKEKSQMFDMGARTIIEKFLPIVDNFERGLAAVPKEQKDDAFVTGMDKIYKQLMSELDAAGVVPIEALGQAFDPELHNAVMQVESEEYEPGTVAQELQKGYKYKDTVVRHSMVAVVQE